MYVVSRDSTYPTTINKSRNVTGTEILNRVISIRKTLWNIHQNIFGFINIQRICLNYIFFMFSDMRHSVFYLLVSLESSCRRQEKSLKHDVRSMTRINYVEIFLINNVDIDITFYPLQFVYLIKILLGSNLHLKI